MSLIAQPQSRFSWDVERYHRAIETGVFTKDDRIELVEGELLPVPPIGPAHQSVVDELSKRLTITLVDEYRVRTQGPLTLRPRSEPEPDIVVARAGTYAASHPGPDDTLVAIEVSDSSRGRDEYHKLPLYARHSIPEFWLVDVNERVIRVYTEPAGEAYREQTSVPFEERQVNSPTLTITLTFDFDFLDGDSPG